MGLPKDLKLVRRVIALSLPSSDDTDTATAYFDEGGIAQICNVALFDAGYDGSSANIVDRVPVKAALSGNGKAYQLACSIVAGDDDGDGDGDSVVDFRCSYRRESGKLTVAAKFGSAAAAAKAQSVESMSIKKPTRSDFQCCLFPSGRGYCITDPGTEEESGGQQEAQGIGCNRSVGVWWGRGRRQR